MTTASPSPNPTASSAKSRATTPHDRQRQQLEKLLKDPAKPAFVPPPPKEKAVRPPREMMKNVQGSSAGAGSGEFHVYKAGRRREYERLKIMDETAQKEAAISEFEEKKRKREEEAEAKTAKNRAKRQKKKEKGLAKSDMAPQANRAAKDSSAISADTPLKKRRVVNGKVMVFRKPGEEEEDSDKEEEVLQQPVEAHDEEASSAPATVVPIDDKQRIIIHEDD